MNQTHWNILSVQTGRELVAHQLLAGMGYEVYTPFENKRQLVRKRKKGDKIRHIHYACPLLPGWLFIRFDGSKEMEARLYMIMERRPFFYGAVTYEGALYGFSYQSMEKYQEYILGRSEEKNSRISGRGFDPKLDSRKNRQRIYGQTISEPLIFDEGTVVEFTDGKWPGLKFEVAESTDAFIRLQTEIMGKMTELEAEPFNLQKIA